MEFKQLVISIGNLTTGGTGKTILTEYLIEGLKNEYSLAVLSRGYKRKTSGFILADNQANAESIGDEPFQIKKKFPGVPVAVSENRVNGIRSLLRSFPDLRILILDDAFQHRAVKPGLSILLLDYTSLYSRKNMLPTGDYREYFSGITRADILIITKTPGELTGIQKRTLIKDFEPEAHQQLFFSYLDYGDPINPKNESFSGLNHLPEKEIVVFSGIGNPEVFNNYFLSLGCKIHKFNFPDHHSFSAQDIEMITTFYDGLNSENKLIITTEKDYSRIANTENLDKLLSRNFFYLPVSMRFHGTDGKLLNEKINYLLSSRL